MTKLIIFSLDFKKCPLFKKTTLLRFFSSQRQECYSNQRCGSFIFKTYSRFHSSSSLGNITISTLNNGIRIVTEYINSPLCTVGIWIELGSRFEPTRHNGIANLLGRLSINGMINAANNDATHRKQKQSLTTILGAQFKYIVNREFTLYSASCLKKDISPMMNIMASVIENPPLDNHILEICKSNVYKEILTDNKRMENVVMNHLHAVAFQGSPLAKPVLGNENSLSLISKNDLEDFMTKNYAAEKMVIVGTGNGFHHDEFVKLTEKLFHQLPSKSSHMKPPPAFYTGAEVRMRDDTMCLAHTMIAFQGPSYKSADYLPLLIAQTIIGNWDRSFADGYYLSSKLAQNLSSQQLAHSFSSFYIPYSDVGLWGIYLVSDKKYELDDLVYLVQQEWIRLCINLTEGEIERAKNQIKRSIYVNLGSSYSICQDIGSQLLMFGKIYSVQELIDMIDKIDLNTVKRICSEYIYDRCPVVSAFGPIETVPDYNRIRYGTLWLRV